MSKKRSSNIKFLRLKKLLLWSPRNTNRLPRYIVLSITILLFIWLTTFIYLKTTQPTFRSNWTLVLPGKGAGANVNLVDIGHTSTAAASPYASSSLSAKANYKEFAKSHSVLRRAASFVNLTIKEFGIPRIKLVEQTSLLYFTIEGRTPTQAQKKANALHDALMELLDRLRDDEIKQQVNSALLALEVFKRKLESASKRLLDFQTSSNLVSMSQFNQLVMSVEQFRREKMQAITALNEIEGKESQLRPNLGISAKQASNSLVLQNDQYFQLSIKNLSVARLNLTKLRAKWGENHPQVKQAKVQYDSARSSLSMRFQTLVGFEKGRNNEILKLQSDDTRNKLLRDLIEFDVNKRGLIEKIKSYENLISELIVERNSLTLPASRLDELVRNHQVAEAIFTSALARTDTTKSDVFVSYPLVQILDTPNLPLKPSSPNKLFAIIGAGISSIFSILGLVVLWKRKPYIQKILKSA